MHSLPTQTDPWVKALALRAFLEMDWTDIAPPEDDRTAWLAHWQVLQAACNFDWDPEVLRITNATWAADERFDCIADLRRFVETHRVAVTRLMERHRGSAGWG